MTRRVAVTGLGVLSPIGSGRERFWRNACAGSNGIAEVRGFDTSMFDLHMGGEVRDVDPAGYVRVQNPSDVPRTRMVT